MNNALVTIAVPVYRRFEYFREAVQSALNQTYPNIEIIISQDPSSPEDTRAIREWSEALVKRDGRVRYYENTTRLKAGANSNRITDLARGEYITFLADDDRLLPEFVERFVEQFQPGIQIVFSNHYVMNAQGVRMTKESFKKTREWKRDGILPGLNDNLPLWAWRGSIPIAAVMLKTEQVRKIRFDEKLKIIDHEFLIRFSKTNDAFVFLPEYLSEYRIHPLQDSGETMLLQELRYEINCLASITADGDVLNQKKKYIATKIIFLIALELIHGMTRRARLHLIRFRSFFNWRKSFVRLVSFYLLSFLPFSFGSKSYFELHRLKQSLKKHFVKSAMSRHAVNILSRWIMTIRTHDSYKWIHRKFYWSRGWKYYLRLRRPGYFSVQKCDRHFYAQILHKDALIFDVGAHCGDKTDIFLNFASRVICVEPDKMSVKILKRRFHAQKNQVVIVEKAVGQFEGVSELKILEEASGFNTLSDKWKAALERKRSADGRLINVFKTKYLVPTVSLASLIHLYGVPFYIKLDIEGYELEAIKGLTQSVPLVSFEANLPEFYDETIKCLSCLVQLDSSLVFNYRIDSNFCLDRWVSCSDFIELLKNCDHTCIDIFGRSDLSLGRS
jgi:FkbM family methyltransferase